MLYIIRGIKANQTADMADIGMNNILALGKYANVKNAKRYLRWDHCKALANYQGYQDIGLFDAKGIILKASTI